jgi:HK97 family phage portal protein
MSVFGRLDNWWEKAFPSSGTRRLLDAQRDEQKANAAYRAIITGGAGQPVWTPREYTKLIEEGYSISSIGYACITYITQRFAALPVKLYTVNAKGKVEEVNQHPALDLLARPNPLQTEFEFRELWGVYLLAGGNAYTHGAAAGPLSLKAGQPQELWPWRPDKVQVVQGDWLDPVRGYLYDRTNDPQTNEPFTRDAVGHARLPNPLNAFYGMSPLEAAARGIDQHNAASAWNAAMLQNRAEPTGILTLKGNVSPEKKEAVKQTWGEKMSGPDNARRTLVVSASEGIDYVRLALTALEMDWKEGKIQSALDVCQAFQVPGQVVGVPGSQTFANYEQAERSGYYGAILPLAGRYCDHLTHWLLPKYPGADPNLYFWYDDSGVQALQEDEEKRAQRAARLFEAGVITQRQAAKLAGEDDDLAQDLFAYDLNRPTAAGAQQRAQEDAAKAMEQARTQFGPRVMAALKAHTEAGRN